VVLLPKLSAERLDRLVVVMIIHITTTSRLFIEVEGAELVAGDLGYQVVYLLG
jgi:hypothetical protein